MADRGQGNVDSIVALEALGRLLTVAQGSSGQSAKVATFLLAWHNAEENGCWSPVDLWQLDTVICDDVLLVLRLVAQEHRYPDDLGFGLEIANVWHLWRGPTFQVKL
jgi:hypothetical protein